MERESRNNVFVGFLEDVSLAGRVGLTSILVGAKLRNMPKPVKEKATNWCYSVALTHLAVRQNLLDPRNKITSSLESLSRMSGGSQIGNCMKSLGSSNRRKGRRDLRISVTRVTKNDMRSVKCPFRRACAVQ